MELQPFPSEAPLDPREFVCRHGAEALAERLRISGGYVIQARPLKALEKALRRNKPLLCEGQRGSGKTALAKGLARAFNLPVSHLQCMDGLKISDVLYEWETTAQDQFVRQQVNAGVPLKEAQAAQWTRDFLKLGAALEPFDYAARSPFSPLSVVDEIDKLDDKGEDMLLQLLQEGYATVPRLLPDPRVGVLEQNAQWPVVILTSNNMRSGVSSPLRSRCYYTYIKSATPEEEVQILSAQVPDAKPHLLAQTVKLMRYVKRMGGVFDKPALRESIEFLKTLVDEEVDVIDRVIVEDNLCALAKRETDFDEMASAVAAIMRHVEREDAEIDTWAAQACAQTQRYVEKVDELR